MDIIWELTKDLKLRNKLALTYTIAFTAMLGITFLIIYFISERYRREEFYKRLSDRTFSTFKISIQVDLIDNKLLRLFDANTINSLSDEQVLLFDSSGKLIYSNVDSGDFSYSIKILKRLQGKENISEQSGDKYEVLGLEFKDRGKTYYGIARAYDRFGRSKVHFLSLLLIVTFSIVTVFIVTISIFLSRFISGPIMKLTHDVETISPDNLSKRIRTDFANDEIGFLANKFNMLLEKVDNAFKFQRHYINHLSHELKTPLAVMMANAERALTESDGDKLKSSMHFQKSAIMELSTIINIMLDISKMESNLTSLRSEFIRIDEIIFECIEEISYINNAAKFDFNIGEYLDETALTVLGNSRMIKMVVMNLIKNAVNYSSDCRVLIQIRTDGSDVSIYFINDGETIAPIDQSKLFKHSFRGKNSAAIKGFGLGLVLATRIVNLHTGKLKYEILDNKNCFILNLTQATST